MPNPDNPGTDRVGPLLSHTPDVLPLQPEYVSMKMEAFLRLKIISVLTWTRSPCFSGAAHSCGPSDKGDIAWSPRLSFLSCGSSVPDHDSFERRRHDWDSHLLSWSGNMCSWLLQATNVGEHNLDLVPEREVLRKVSLWFRAYQPA